MLRNRFSVLIGTTIVLMGIGFLSGQVVAAADINPIESYLLPFGNTVSVDKTAKDGVLEQNNQEIQLDHFIPNNEEIKLIFLSGILDKESVKLTVDPEIPFQIEVLENVLIVKGSFQPGQVYQLKVEQGLKDTVGRKLKKTLIVSPEIPYVKLGTKLGFVTEGEFLPLRGEKLVLPYQARNCEQIQVIIEKAYDNNLNPYFENIYDDKMTELYNEVLTLHDPENKIVLHELDLEKLLGKREAGCYKVTLKIIGEDDYWYNWDIRRFIITDIALQTTLDDFGGKAVVFARSISENKPLTGVEIKLLSYKNQLVSSGKTDESGCVVMDYLPSWRKEGDYPVGALARTVDDLSYFRLNDFHPIQAEAIVLKPNEPRAFVFMERGICRPGETFHVSVFLRQPDPKGSKPMKEAPLSLVVWDPKRQKFAEAALKTDEYGLAQTEFTIPATALTGMYQVECQAAGMKSSCGSERIRVATYVPDRIRVTGSSIETAKSDTAFNFEFDSQYYFGMPLQDGSYFYRVKAAPAQKLSLWDSSWTYGCGDEFNSGIELFNRGNKDAEPVVINYPGFNKVGGKSFLPVEVCAEFTVSEPGGRGVTGSREVLVYPTDWFIGVREQKNNQEVEIDQSRKSLEFTLLPLEFDEENVLIEDTTLIFELIKKEWEYLFVRDGQTGNYSYQWNQRLIPLPEKEKTFVFKSGTVIGDKIQTISWDNLPDGCYDVIVSSGSQYRTRMNFYHYQGEGGVRSSSPNNLYFKTDRQKYLPGEIAEVVFESLGEGDAFVVQGEKQFDKQMSFPVQKGENKLKIEIPADVHSSSYFAACTVVEKKEGTYRRSFGLLRLNVDQTTEHALNIALDLPQKALPGEEISVKVKLTDNQGTSEDGVVLLYGVDSGVISLTDYQTPDIYGFFYGPIGCGMEFSDMYGSIFPNLKITPEGRIGGDMQSKLLKLKQKDTARVICPPVKVDSSGEVTLKVKLPKHVGAMDIFAVAANEERAGSKAQTILTRERGSVIISAPRYMAPGDVAEVSFNIFNNDSPAEDYTLNVVLPDSLEKVIPNSGLFTGKDLGMGKQITLTLPVRAKEQFEPALLQAELKLGDDVISSDTYINIRSVNAPRTQQRIRILSPAEEMSIDVDTDNYIGKPQMKARLSASPALGIQSALDWLNNYPYGCLEQTVSGAFPYISVPSLVKLGLLDEATAKRQLDKIRGAYAMILSMRLSDDFFAMWPGNSRNWLEGSLFAWHFIFEAEQKNLISLDQNSRNNYLFNLRMIANDPQVGIKYNAYAAYILAIARNPDFHIYARNIFATETADPYSLFLAGAAMVQGGYASEGADWMRLALKKKCWKAEHLFSDFMNENALKGMTLYILMKSNIKEDEIASWLALNLISNGDKEDGYVWGTTSANAWASLGLSAYAERYPADKLSALMTRSDQSTQSFDSQNGTVQVDITGGEKIKNNSRGVLMVETFVTGIPRKPEKTGGIQKVRKTYLDEEGNPINEVFHGEKVYVKLEIDSPVRENTIVIADLLPGGLEIEDEFLATRSKRIPSALQGFDEENKMQTIWIEKRDDRYILVGHTGVGKSVFIYQARAVSSGIYAVPPLLAEAMYNPEIKGHYTSSETFVIK